MAPQTNSHSMTGRTANFDARTQSFSSQPSRSTLAARSIREVDRIIDDDERRTAFARHMTEFAPTIGSY